MAPRIRAQLFFLVACTLQSATAFVAPIRPSFSPSPALRATRPLVAQYPPGYGYAPGPPKEPNNGVTIPAIGLLATISVSASALSMTGTLATIAASLAGLFSYKLAKELGTRGVNKASLGMMAANTAAATGTVAVRAVVSLGIAAAYVLASIVSFVVWVLTRLGEAVLYLAEMANRIKPEPGERPSLRQSFDPSSLPYPNPMGGGMPAAVPEPPMPTTTAAYSPPGIGRGSYAPRGFGPPPAPPPPAAPPPPPFCAKPRG